MKEVRAFFAGVNDAGNPVVGLWEGYGSST